MRRSPPAALAALALLAAGVITVGVIAGTRTLTAAPNVAWFGGVTHGPRTSDAVALTFDDGLNDETTLAIAGVLERHGARGTFFAVGHTLPAQREVARTLIGRGHLLANHSQDHAWPSLFDTRYEDVARAQTTFAETLGTCPRYFRPPHGMHTPFMLRAVERAGMRLVNWDVEVRDWDATDADRLAADVLDAVRPGSIVLLHDGRDGETGVDRAVLVAALPKILDGLQERGLRAVRLDALLGEPGDLERCDQGTAAR